MTGYDHHTMFPLGSDKTAYRKLDIDGGMGTTSMNDEERRVVLQALGWTSRKGASESESRVRCMAAEARAKNGFGPLGGISRCKGPPCRGELERGALLVQLADLVRGRQRGAGVAQVGRDGAARASRAKAGALAG